MNLLIQIKDGEPFEHPIVLENFITAFPSIDINNLPPNFAEFERVPPPNIGPYEELIGLSYQWRDGIVKDVWQIRQFSEEEKNVKKNFVKKRFAQFFPTVQSWIFNEELCGFVCPVSYPNDGEIYFWKEDAEMWININDDPTLDRNNLNGIIFETSFITF